MRTDVLARFLNRYVLFKKKRLFVNIYNIRLQQIKPDLFIFTTHVCNTFRLTKGVEDKTDNLEQDFKAIDLMYNSARYESILF